MAAAGRDQATRPEDRRARDDATNDRFLNLLRHIPGATEVTDSGDTTIEVQPEFLHAPDRDGRLRVAEHGKVVAALLPEVHVQVDEARHQVQALGVDGPVDLCR